MEERKHTWCAAAGQHGADLQSVAEPGVGVRLVETIEQFGSCDDALMHDHGDRTAFVVVDHPDAQQLKVLARDEVAADHIAVADPGDDVVGHAHCSGWERTAASP